MIVEARTIVDEIDIYFKWLIKIRKNYDNNWNYNEALEKIDFMMDLVDPTDEQIKQMQYLAIEIEEYEEKLFQI